MPLDAFLAVLLSALLHASWNALAKGRGGSDPLLGTLVIALGCALWSVLVLLVAGLPDPASYPYALASGAIHVLYFLLVGLAYRSGDYAIVYPITRGSAPLGTALLSAAVLGEMLSLRGVLGIGLLCAGVVWLGVDGLRTATLTRRGVVLIALNILVIVAYTVVDGSGARLSGNPAAYVSAMMALTGLGLLPIALSSVARQPPPVAVRPLLVAALAGGALVLLSYGIALWAMTRAPIALVGALRETSVLFASAIGVLLLGERVSARRWAAAGCVLIGIVLLRIA